MGKILTIAVCVEMLGVYHVKVMGIAILLALLRGVNYRFWPRLGCLGQKVTIFAHSGMP